MASDGGQNSEWVKKNITRESTETFLASKGLSVAQFEMEGIFLEFSTCGYGGSHYYVYNSMTELAVVLCRGGIAFGGCTCDPKCSALSYHDGGTSALEHMYDCVVRRVKYPYSLLRVITDYLEYLAHNEKYSFVTNLKVNKGEILATGLRLKQQKEKTSK